MLDVFANTLFEATRSTNPYREPVRARWAGPSGTILSRWRGKRSAGSGNGRRD